ncbi:hypothetical protein [Paraoerskovia sediminicola]|nr:hypothetical protein [Paraoerskovia sediminicola]
MWTRPGFVVAGGTVVAIVILGAVLAVTAGDDDEPSTAEPSQTPSANPFEPAPDTNSESVCGLEGDVMEGTVSAGPEADWSYQGTTAYPTSPIYGPADTFTANDVRFCFQRSPEGALFAAANALAQSADPDSVEAWGTYFLARGSAKDELLAENSGETSTSGSRVNLVGFRVLSYDGDTALVDLATQGAVEGQSFTMSIVYDLVWESGDWKLVVDDPDAPLDAAMIPDLAGYVSWGHERWRRVKGLIGSYRSAAWRTLQVRSTPSRTRSTTSPTR